MDDACVSVLLFVESHERHLVLHRRFGQICLPTSFLSDNRYPQKRQVQQTETVHSNVLVCHEIHQVKNFL